MKILRKFSASIENNRTRIISNTCYVKWKNFIREIIQIVNFAVKKQKFRKFFKHVDTTRNEQSTGLEQRIKINRIYLQQVADKTSRSDVSLPRWRRNKTRRPVIRCVYVAITNVSRVVTYFIVYFRDNSSKFQVVLSDWRIGLLLGDRGGVKNLFIYQCWNFFSSEELIFLGGIFAEMISNIDFNLFIALRVLCFVIN